MTFAIRCCSRLPLRKTRASCSPTAQMQFPWPYPYHQQMAPPATFPFPHQDKKEPRAATRKRCKAACVRHTLLPRVLGFSEQCRRGQWTAITDSLPNDEDSDSLVVISRKDAFWAYLLTNTPTPMVLPPLFFVSMVVFTLLPQTLSS